jgi:hypothetical protein
VAKDESDERGAGAWAEAAVDEGRCDDDDGDGDVLERAEATFEVAGAVDGRGDGKRPSQPWTWKRS